MHRIELFHACNRNCVIRTPFSTCTHTGLQLNAAVRARNTVLNMLEIAAALSDIFHSAASSL
jgi:hypothetical protein